MLVFTCLDEATLTTKCQSTFSRNYSAAKGWILSFIKNTDDNDVRPKEWRRSKPRPRNVLRKDVNKESQDPVTFPWPESYSLFQTTTSIQQALKYKRWVRLWTSTPASLASNTGEQTVNRMLISFTIHSIIWWLCIFQAVYMQFFTRRYPNVFKCYVNKLFPTKQAGT